MNPTFILALLQHGYKVRTSTLYHLLKGKRTSSVLLYGFLYENLRFFQFTPDLSESKFNQLITRLIEQKLLYQTSDDKVQITAQGEMLVQAADKDFSQIDNYRFGKTDEAIWRLLQFTVQVVSHLSYVNKDYIPLEQSPLYQKQVKMYIKSMPKSLLIKNVKEEWHYIFSCLGREDANFFAQQFSGYERTGKASFQLMESRQKAFEQFLIKKAKLHHLLFVMEQLPERSFLKRLVAPLINQNENKSMAETRMYLKTESSLEILAQQRGIKVSTIKDHLMELALTNDFPFERFISNKTGRILAEQSKPYQEWEYRTIKNIFPELDYFEFRLYQIQKLREEREYS
ncbi:hypothetical protein BCR24_08860 [Enterococcus ureilyticus]|uniref:Helicase Helix-turn-helix domain-containing protein n=1 Tax=Enterococcus ureilyticus TaxID=1131292 RepID=A0A1E5H8C3_9ENTE|nr:helix-turn-helix domain-containing protein [Enterococcus ureilyticus]MBM7688688.1 uncharacterized protein YpbB [Enterococcus ureilyticus]OEG21181.1 hypothetical protein BCR24_08860 [Enterococcus ureilyticus]